MKSQILEQGQLTQELVSETLRLMEATLEEPTSDGKAKDANSPLARALDYQKHCNTRKLFEGVAGAMATTDRALKPYSRVKQLQ